MRRPKIRLFLLVLMIASLFLANASQTKSLSCNQFCWRDCNDQFEECLNNESYPVCCGQFNACIQACGTSCLQCILVAPEE